MLGLGFSIPQKLHSRINGGKQGYYQLLFKAMVEQEYQLLQSARHNWSLGGEKVIRGHLICVPQWQGDSWSTANVALDEASSPTWLIEGTISGKSGYPQE